MAVNVLKRLRQHTRTIVRFLYASIVGLGLPLAALGGVAHASPITQCQSVATPAGYVVIAVTTSAACGGTSYNNYTYDVLTNNMNMCTPASRVPTGWMVTSIGSTSTCGAILAYGNQYTITSTLVNGMSICSQASRVPTGWVVTSLGNNPTCYTYISTGNQYTMTSSITAGMAICSQPTRVPTGWVVTSLGNSGYCGNNISTGNQYILNPPANNLVMCAVSSIPAGYHWVAWTNSSYCGAFVGGGSGNAEIIHT